MDTVLLTVTMTMVLVIFACSIGFAWFTINKLSNIDTTVRLVLEQIYNGQMPRSDEDEDGPPNMNGPMIFKSADGKHVARSMEELFFKMMNDPATQKEDIDKLRSLFENMNNNEDDDDDDEE